MAKQDIIRAKLESKVFTPYGKTVVLSSLSSPTYNTRGEVDSQLSSTSSIKIVPYNITTRSLEQQPFGDLQNGSLYAAIPYNTTVNVKDLITMEGNNWEIVELLPNYLPENVVTIVRLIKT